MCLPSTLSGTFMGRHGCLLRPEDAALQAYTQVRRGGERELGAVLLGITTELLTFDFKETFVDPFAVRPLPRASASCTLCMACCAAMCSPNQANPDWIVAPHVWSP